mmetsp:Transcript_10523/g.12302  ORF Transcript_10523/g.12302 Transcript_10523/m.12302 type:complete len:224 (+) Transcript_10523:165-836(+)|eukprot:CAMPEP_0197861720 /NCGR_PEP_ID=MMETSP1438-20131217/37956_1 /TAXON_ID=1461541 /ORGANISM="Pterosperma sp., Strain CCMP1384" /LENGTH=223 /DNA_ID=CAMNT_0043478987 /DNA_START=157 /DNA_END=828 /DNA_ORIENTATION=-
MGLSGRGMWLLLVAVFSVGVTEAQPGNDDYLRRAQGDVLHKHRTRQREHTLKLHDYRHDKFMMAHKPHYTENLMELKRCQDLGIPYHPIHPSTRVTGDEEYMLANFPEMTDWQFPKKHDMTTNDYYYGDHRKLGPALTMKQDFYEKGVGYLQPEQEEEDRISREVMQNSDLGIMAFWFGFFMLMAAAWFLNRTKGAPGTQGPPTKQFLVNSGIRLINPREDDV